MIKENRNVWLSFTTATTNAAYGTVQKIMTEQLQYQKICSRDSTHTVGQATARASHHVLKKFAVLSKRGERLSEENHRRRRNLGASFHSTIKAGFVVLESCQFSSFNEGAMLTIYWKSHDDVVS